jgi:YHS domain-containing protein
MGRFLYFLVILFLVRMAWNALAATLVGHARRQMGARGGNGARGERATPAIHKGLMVRDPVCGLHVPEDRAVTEVRAGERYHFCSDACRQSFLKAS